VRFGLPDDYWQRYPEQVRALSKARLPRPPRTWSSRTAWSGGRVTARRSGRHPELGYGDIILMDADGNILP
jgi:hypothetical protein